MRAFVIPVIVSILILGGLGYSQEAEAEEFIATQDGNWADAATWGGAGPPTIFSNDLVTIPLERTVTNTGLIGGQFCTVNNFGTIINIGTFGNDFDCVINNFGTIENPGFFDIMIGTINNFGTFENSDKIFNVHCQFGFTCGVINNYGTFNNSGLILSDSCINCTTSGTINNFSDGIINNNSGGTLDTAGDETSIINNSGIINNNSGGTINNSGTINNNSDGTINNFSDGTINNNSGGTINNSGTINNFSGANINFTFIIGTFSGTLTGPITGPITGTITGTIDNIVGFDNSDGTINNSGTITGTVISSDQLSCGPGTFDNGNGKCDPDVTQTQLDDAESARDDALDDLAIVESDLIIAETLIEKLQALIANISVVFVQPILDAIDIIPSITDDASLTRTFERSLSTLERADGVACNEVLSFMDNVGTLLADTTITETEANTLLDRANDLLDTCTP